MKKIILSGLVAIMCATIQAQTLEKGTVLKLANGTSIEVTSSHAAPCIYDFNGDGVMDLLVGEFGEEPVDIKDEYVKSKCRVYINKGTNESPRYDDYSYLQADGKDAWVPVTCCISFMPRFTDMDGDDINDIVTGDYKGNVYLFKGLGGEKFAAAKIIFNTEGLQSICAEPIDWNADGITDLLISYRYGNPQVVINTGTKTAPKFESKQEINVEKCDFYYEPLNNQLRKSTPSHTLPVDFDGDSLFDLVCGDESGNLFWYKNTGSKGKPHFTKLVKMFENDDMERPEGLVTAMGGRVKVFVYDYNRDGKLDILAGDIYGHRRKIRDLSPKEEVTKANLEEKLNDLIEESLELQAEGESSKKIDKQIEKTSNKLRKYENYEYRSSGYVWLFLQK